MDANEKEELIEGFLEAVKEDGRVLKYINEENVRGILEEQIRDVEYGDIEVASWMAAYNGEERKFLCRPQYKGDFKVAMHETFHALTNNMQSSLTLGQQATVMKSGFHFYYRGKGKNWHDQYEIGRGLNEGTTQYLTRHIAGAIKNTNLLKALGVDIVSDASYPGEQQIVEELVTMYGEDAVLGSYFETSPERLLQAIGESGAIKNPQAVLMGLMSKLDVHEMLGRNNMLITDSKSYKKEFKKIQQYITKELIEKEVSFALKSKEAGALARVQQMLENLQGLNVSIDGRNIFENVIERFNDKVQGMQNGEEFMVEPSAESEDKTKMKLSLMEQIQVSNLMHQRGSVKFIKTAAKDVLTGLFQGMKKVQKTKLMNRDKNLLGLISVPRDDVEINQSPPEEVHENTEEQKREALLASIRGCPKEEYEKSRQEAEQAWANQKHEDRDTRNSQMDR